MNEIFKVINEFPDYAVSNLGNVYSYKNGKVVKLKPGITHNGNGYLKVQLWKNGEQKWFSVHRLVAEAFIPNPLGLPQVNHINEDKEDNRAKNLEWCTAGYNNNYGTRTEKYSKQVEQYDLNGNLINVWKSTMEIQRQLGFYCGNISSCCLGRYKTAYGFIWRYK